MSDMEVDSNNQQKQQPSNQQIKSQNEQQNAGTAQQNLQMQQQQHQQFQAQQPQQQQQSGSFAPSASILPSHLPTSTDPMMHLHPASQSPTMLDIQQHQIPQQLSPASAAQYALVQAFRTDCLQVLCTHQTHTLIPHSGKVVVFDSRLLVRNAFDGLVVHDM
jgi:hypothetical protein